MLAYIGRDGEARSKRYLINHQVKIPQNRYHCLVIFSNEPGEDDHHLWRKALKGFHHQVDTPDFEILLVVACISVDLEVEIFKDVPLLYIHNCAEQVVKSSARCRQPNSINAKFEVVRIEEAEEDVNNY